MTSMKKMTAASFALLAMMVAWSSAAPKLKTMEELGKKLFFDKNLSTPPGQSCAACHDPMAGWTGPLSATTLPGAVYEGAVKGRFGNRKPPASAYAGASPIFHKDESGDFVGGMFWDGRATGADWKDPLAEQAGGPFLNPLEQNNPDKKTVVLKVKNSDYASLFAQVWNIKADEWEKNVDKLYECIARSIAAYERSAESTAFSSKFDVFWKNAQGKKLTVEEISPSNWRSYADLGLAPEELKGLMLFNTKGKCSNCHTLKPGEKGTPPLFTDYSYDNLGVPKNPDNPFYAMGPQWNKDGKNWVDGGLGDFLKTQPHFANYAEVNMGKHKVPTLRNADVKPAAGFVKAFMHNGSIKSLKDVVHFYNTRDIGSFPPPEVAANINKSELGNLGLTDEEENAVVAFMKALSDGFMPQGK